MSVTYTVIDQRNALKYKEYNTTCRLLEALHRKAPWVASHLTWSSRPADPEQDFYVPEVLLDCAYVLDVNLSKEACEQIACTPMRETEVCDPQEKASYYNIGDDGQWGVQCQPACFNLTASATYNEDGSRAPDIFQTRWLEKSKKCGIVNSAIVGYLEKPFYRSTTIYDRRTNDLRLGFNRSFNGDDMMYHVNKYYCDVYERDFDEGSLNCREKLLDKFLSAVGLGNLYKLTTESIRMIVNGTMRLPQPNPAPAPPPANLLPQHTLEGWKANINKSFKLPKERFPAPSASTDRAKRSPEQLSALNQMRRAAEAEENGRLYSDYLCNLLGRRPTKDKPQSINRTKRELKITSEDIDKLVLGMIEQLGTKEFYEDMAIDIGTETLLQYIKKYSLKLSERLSKLLVQGGLKQLAGRVSTRLFATAARSILANTVGRTIVRFMTRAAVQLLKITASAASGIGIFLSLVFILDFGLEYLDVFGFSKYFPEGFVEALTESGEYSLRQALQTSNTNVEFDQLCSQILDKDELDQIAILSFLDVFIYLDTLVVNSEGSRIDKSDTIDFDSIRNQESNALIEAARQRQLARQYTFDAEDIINYNSELVKRANFQQVLRTCGWLALLVISPVCYILQLQMFSILVILIAISCLVLSQILLIDGDFIKHINLPQWITHDYR